MNLLRKKKKNEKEIEEKESQPKLRNKKSQLPDVEKPRDPTRWLSLLFLLIFLFLSYLSWVAYGG